MILCMGEIAAKTSNKKLSRNKSWTLREGGGGLVEYWASIINQTFGTIRTEELPALRACCSLPARKFHCNNFN